MSHLSFRGLDAFFIFLRWWCYEYCFLRGGALLLPYISV